MSTAQSNTIAVRSRGFNWNLPYNDVLTDPFLNESEIHEPHLITFINEYLSNGDIAMDIGACFGYHTLEMARVVGETGHVYAFEPQSEMFQLLCENIKNNNLSQTTLHNNALGDVSIDVCMYNAYDEKTNYGDSFPLLIKFIDEGTGIKKEDLSNIFSPFFTTKERGYGTGLGLSTSYGIVREHGGVIEVESREGVGSVFTIRLPLGNSEEDNNHV